MRRVLGGSGSHEGRTGVGRPLEQQEDLVPHPDCSSWSLLEESGGGFRGGGGGAHKSSTHLQGRSRGRSRGAQHQKLLFWSPGSDPEGWGHQVLNKILTFSFVKSGLRSRILQIRRVLPLNQNPVPGPAPGFSGLGAVERKSSLEVASENCLDTKCD